MCAENKKSQLGVRVGTNLLHIVTTRNICRKNKLVSFVELEILYRLVYKGDLSCRRNDRKNEFTFSPIYYGPPVKYFHKNFF
jgi:hypothetical protein